MTLTKLFENYLQFIWDTFLYDMEVYSTPWVWWWLLIPALLYTMFFCAKWCLLLVPLYAPFLIFCKTLILMSAVSSGTNIEENLKKFDEDDSKDCSGC